MKIRFGRISCLLIFVLLLLIPLAASAKDKNEKNNVTTVSSTSGDDEKVGNPPPPSITETKSISDPPEPPQENTGTKRSPFHSIQFILSISLLGFGLLIIMFEVYLARIGKIDADNIFKCIILTLVITSAMVLITAGYSNDQITGVVGLLGSIAGYMLGKGAPEKKEDKSAT